MNADYNVANNAARRAALRLQRGQNSLAGDSFCWHGLNSEAMVVNATELASDTS
jgi:hypothetical protein